MNNVFRYYLGLKGGLLMLLVTLFSCQKEPSEVSRSQDPWIYLWNGVDLKGWHTYLGTPFQQRTDSAGAPLEPFGIDYDPLEVISITTVNNDTVIRISGVAWGMIYTEKDYQNYHLKLKVKWGQDKHPPRKDMSRDSGLLYYGFGEPGSAYNWMGSQELQIQQGDMGDYWPVGEVEIDIPSSLHDSLYYIYDQNAPLRTYYLAEILSTHSHDSMAKRRVLKALDAERPHGQWNDIELIAFGDSSVHVVNGKVVMRLYNSRRSDLKVPLRSGKIILQSEGAEVYYKDLKLRSIERIPEQFREP